MDEETELDDNARFDAVCRTCCWASEKADGTYRCCANPPTMEGFPTVKSEDFCREHQF